MAVFIRSLFLVLLLAGSAFAEEGGRLFGDEIYDPSQSTYEDFKRPLFFESDSYSYNHPTFRSDYPPPPPSTPGPNLISLKSLDRTPDHILVTGDLIPSALGLSIENFRVYSHRADVFEPITFQIDERDEEYWYVLTDGPSPSTGGTGLLKEADELVFRARDTGDRITAELWPEGYEQCWEIEVIDPVTQGKSWVYLFYFPRDPPPGSPEDYVDQIDHGEDGQAYVGRYYTMKYAYQSPMWVGFWGSKEAGYEELTIFDRGYLTLKFKFLGLFNLRVSMENLVGTVPSFKDGPVRVIRRTHIKLKAGRLRIPIGIKYDLLFYDQYLNIPVHLSTPVNLKYLASSAWALYGTDLNSNAIGSKWYSNYFPDGVTITGQPDDDPTKENMKDVFIKSEDDEKYYHLVVGKHGTLMRRHVAMAGEVRDKADLYVTFEDDVNKPDPPEFFPGQIGNSKNLVNIIDIPGGDYYSLSEWYACENFTYPDDVEKYLNIVNNPCTVVIRENAETVVGEGSSSPLAPLFEYQH